MVARKYLISHRNATLTIAMGAGTSTNGPITVANAAPLFISNTAIAAAMANSKLLLAAVKESAAVTG
ncbi:MAG TPA: hypothetical protein GX497_10325 [Bacillus bacterium]|nr:hypothetical protein [Bacillus sp. (in: firmicutes)]